MQDDGRSLGRCDAFGEDALPVPWERSIDIRYRLFLEESSVECPLYPCEYHCLILLYILP
jgi:hypothetical protein